MFFRLNLLCRQHHQQLTLLRHFQPLKRRSLPASVRNLRPVGSTVCEAEVTTGGETKSMRLRQLLEAQGKPHSLLLESCTVQADLLSPSPGFLNCIWTTFIETHKMSYVGCCARATCKLCAEEHPTTGCSIACEEHCLHGQWPSCCLHPAAVRYHRFEKGIASCMTTRLFHQFPGMAVSADSYAGCCCSTSDKE